MTGYVPYIHSLLNEVWAGLPWILPEGILTLTFLLSIFSGLFFKKKTAITWGIVFLGTVASTLVALVQTHIPAPETLFFGMIELDIPGAWMKVFIGTSCLLFLLFLSYHQALKRHPKGVFDLLSILLAIQIGLNFMVMACHWMLVYLSIEMVSVGSYVLVGYLSANRKQSEAAMKYALFGTVCSAVMLYGLSLVYGYTGSLTFTDAVHLSRLAAMPLPLFLVSMLFVFTGIGFKLSMVPFHLWSPDVYQGAPTPVTAFLSTAPKIAAIGLLGRFVMAWSHLLHQAIPPALFYFLIVVAIMSLLLGNLAALRQDEMKRMMAYSSIGHTGFLMMILLSDVKEVQHVLYFYLISYVIMNMGVFMITDYLEEKLGYTRISQYRGLGRTFPTAMVPLTILMVSLIGLPPTAGFMAKLLGFSAVIEAYQASGDPAWLLLLLIGAITTVIALFFYFKIPLNAFLRGQPEEADHDHLKKLPLNGLLTLAFLLALCSLLFGLYPSLILPA